MSAAKRGGLQPSTLDNVDELADRALLLSGRFDDRLKQIKKAKDEAAPYLKIADTIDKANEILADAEKKAAAKNVELDARAKALADRGAELTLVAADLSERKAKVEFNENELAEKASTLARAEDIRSKEWDKAESKFEAFEKKTREKLAADRLALDQAKGNFESEKADFAAYKERDNAQIARRTEDLVKAQEEHAKRVAAFEKEMKEKSIEVDGLKRDLRARLDTGKSKV